MAGLDLREPVGSTSDLLERRGLPTYSIMELIQWTRTGERPAR